MQRLERLAAYAPPRVVDRAARMSPRGLLFWTSADDVLHKRVEEVTMSVYQTVATAIGTREALDLSHRLATWHDAMVIHRRRVGEMQRAGCDADCPHEQAELLWHDALEVYGERAQELAFLRTHGTAAADRVDGLQG